LIRALVNQRGKTQYRADWLCNDPWAKHATDE